MAVPTLITLAVVATAATVKSQVDARKAASKQKKAQRTEARLKRVERTRQRQKQVARARALTAQTRQDAINLGVGESSGLQGSVSSIGSSLASNLGYLNTQQRAYDNIYRYQGQAASASSSSQLWSGVSSLAMQGAAMAGGMIEPTSPAPNTAANPAPRPTPNPFR